MGEYDSPGRPLPWYLRFSELPENTTEDDTGVASSFVWPEDPDERTLVLFSLSQREWTVLGSSIDVGRDIAYGADSIRVLWLWLRNMRENVAICSAVIDCLTNDEDTQQALADLITSNEIIGQALSDFNRLHPGGTTFPKELPLPTGELTKNITIPNPDCDPDLLYAQCVGIVQTANRMIEDFLETWETYTNSAETIPAIVLSIPLLGEAADVIGIDGIADYANSIIDAIKENYDADYTLDYENILACEIFCAARGDCVITLDMLTGIMNARISGQLTLTNGIELLLSLIDADISGINVADLYLCAFFNMLTLANLVLPITWGIENYLRVTRTFNTPNDDWTVLCTDCPDEPRYPLITGIPSSFPDQVNTFVGYDGDYDLWDVITSTCPTTIMMDNGQTYTHGYNVGIDNGSGGFVNMTITDDVTDGNTDWCLWLDNVGALLNARHFPFTSGPGVIIAQGNTTGIITCRVKVKPR